MKYHLQNWKDITQDHWVLTSIQGYRIPFEEIPPRTILDPFHFSKEESDVISAEIDVLLSKGAVQQVENCQRFVSNVFLVPKSGGEWRLILNLRALNTFLRYDHFKMEDIRTVKDLLNTGEYMCKLDLKGGRSRSSII